MAFVDNDVRPFTSIIGDFTPEDFTIDFGTPADQPGRTASFSLAFLLDHPALSVLETGLSQVTATLSPCGGISPHHLPRGDEILHVVEGIMHVGFVSDTGALVSNDHIQAGQSFIIPQGAPLPTL
jgi:quercetin dioxygenase-like cupin family protein